MDEVVAYVSQLANLMGLGDWEITVSANAPDEDYATVNPVYGQRKALLALDPEWASLTRSTLRWVLVHELVHLHLARLKVGVENYLGRLVEEMRPAAQEALNSEVEYAVDAIATAWARRLPLIRRS